MTSRRKDCPSEEAIFSFVQGETGPEVRGVAKHLKTCPCCRAVAEEYRLVLDRARTSLPGPQLPIGQLRPQIDRILVRIGHSTEAPAESWIDRIFACTNSLGVLLVKGFPVVVVLVAALFVFVFVHGGPSIQTTQTSRPAGFFSRVPFRIRGSGGVGRVRHGRSVERETSDHLKSDTRYRLEDGTVLQIDLGNQLQLTLSDGAEFVFQRATLVLLVGQARLFASVAHPPYKLQTPHATIEVVGTDVQLFVEPGGTTLNLIEGRLNVLTRRGATPLHTPGLFAIDVSGGLSAVTPEDASAAPSSRTVHRPSFRRNSSSPATIPSGADASSSGQLLDR